MTFVLPRALDLMDALLLRVGPDPPKLLGPRPHADAGECSPFNRELMEVQTLLGLVRIVGSEGFSEPAGLALLL